MDNSPPPPPTFVMPPPDPGLAVLQQQTENQNIQAMQTQATLDTASLMQRYGIMSALSGSTAPMSAGAQTVAASLGAMSTLAPTIGKAA